MNPITEADILKALFLQGADLDLTHPHGIEMAQALTTSIQRSLARITAHVDRYACADDCVHPSHHTGNDAMRAIADEPPFSEEPFADQIRATIEARQVDLAKPEVFDIVGFTQKYFDPKGAR